MSSCYFLFLFFLLEPFLHAGVRVSTSCVSVVCRMSSIKFTLKDISLQITAQDLSYVQSTVYFPNLVNYWSVTSCHSPVYRSNIG